MPWYIFALGTPIFYSFSTFIDKFLIEKKIKNPLVLTALANTVAGILGIFLGLIVGFKNIGLAQTSLIIFAGILLTFYLIPYYKAIKIEDISRATPLFQFVPVFTLIISSIFLKETLNNKQIFGLILVVIAGVLMSTDKFEGGIFKLRKSLWFMILSSLMYGLVCILFRFVVKDIDFWLTLSYEYIGSGIGGLLLFLSPQIRKSFKKDFSAIKISAGIIAFNNGVAMLAHVCESYALSLMIVPLVNIVSGLQPMITLVFGVILTIWFPHLIKEDISKKTLLHKSVFILLMFIGLYFVYL